MSYNAFTEKDKKIIKDINRRTLIKFANDPLLKTLVGTDFNKQQFTINRLKNLHGKYTIYRGIFNSATADRLRAEYEVVIKRDTEELAINLINQKVHRIEFKNSLKDKKQLASNIGFDSKEVTDIYKSFGDMTPIWKDKAKQLSKTEQQKIRIIGGSLQKLVDISAFNDAYFSLYKNVEGKTMIEKILYSSLLKKGNLSETLTRVRTSLDLINAFQNGDPIGDVNAANNIELDVKNRYGALKTYFREVGDTFRIMEVDAYDPSKLNPSNIIGGLEIQPQDKSKKAVYFYIHDIAGTERLKRADLAFINAFVDDTKIDENALKRVASNVSITGVINRLKSIIARKSIADENKTFHKFLLRVHEMIMPVLKKLTEEEVEKKEKEDIFVESEEISSKVVLEDVNNLLNSKDPDRIKRALDIGLKILEKANFENDEVDEIVSNLIEKSTTLYNKK